MQNNTPLHVNGYPVAVINWESKTVTFGGKSLNSFYSHRNSQYTIHTTVWDKILQAAGIIAPEEWRLVFDVQGAATVAVVDVLKAHVAGRMVERGASPRWAIGIGYMDLVDRDGSVVKRGKEYASPAVRFELPEEGAYAQARRFLHGEPGDRKAE